MWKVREFLKGIGVKYRALRDRIPRKTQVAINLVSIPILLFLLYIFLGSPVLNWRQQYRRLEKAHMVGPAEIMGYEEVTGMLYNKIVLANTEEAIIVSTVSLGNTGNDIFQYLEKTDGIMVFGGPHDFKRLIPSVAMTVFAVVDQPVAVRAEMELQLYWQQYLEDQPKYPTFHLQAQRKEGGYFRFDIPYGEYEEESLEYQAIKLFSSWSRDAQGINIPENAFRATVRLYDSQNKLIGQETVNLQSIKRK